MRYTIKEIVKESVKRMIKNEYVFHKPETLGDIEILIKHNYTDEVIDMVGWQTIYKWFEEYKGE